MSSKVEFFPSSSESPAHTTTLPDLAVFHIYGDTIIDDVLYKQCYVALFLYKNTFEVAEVHLNHINGAIHIMRDPVGIRALNEWNRKWWNSKIVMPS